MPEAHRPHDVAEVIPGEELLLLRVKQVKADLSSSRLCIRLGRRRSKKKHHLLNLEHSFWGQEVNKYFWWYLKTLDLIVGKIGLLIDLLKVNVSVGISLAWVQKTFSKNSEFAFSCLFAWVQRTFLTRCEFAFYIFTILQSHVVDEFNFDIFGKWDDQLCIKLCLNSPAMIVGWGEVSEVGLETLSGRTRWGRGEGIPLLLSFTHPPIQLTIWQSWALLSFPQTFVMPITSLL